MFLLFVLPPRGSFFAPRGAFCGFSNKHLRVSMDLLTAVLHNALRHVLQRICTSKFEQTFAPLRHKLQQFLHHGIAVLQKQSKKIQSTPKRANCLSLYHLSSDVLPHPLKVCNGTNRARLLSFARRFALPTWQTTRCSFSCGICTVAHSLKRKILQRLLPVAFFLPYFSTYKAN